MHSPKDCPAWLKDKSWYLEFQRGVVRDLADLRLVRTKPADPKPADLIAATQARFPIGDVRLSWEKIFEFASDIVRDKLPEVAIAEECARIANDWTTLFDINDPIRKENLLSSEGLLSSIRNTKSLVELSELLNFKDIGSSLEWVNRLILSVPEDQRRLCLDGLFPDQTGAGVFRTFDKLSRDNGIDENLKNTLEQLGESVRERLLHTGIVGADKLVTRVEKEETLVAAAKDFLKKRKASGISDAGTRAACLSLFAWFAKRGRWGDLKDSMPVVALDTDGSEVLAKTSDRAPQLLIPRTRWPKEAKPFWDAFPPGSVLVDDYAPLLDEDTWDATAQEGIVLGKLIWSERAEITDLESRRWP